MFSSLWSDWRRFWTAIRVTPLVVADSCLPMLGSDGSHTASHQATGSQTWQALSNSMVQYQMAARGIRDPRVLEAMRSVPRHLFVQTQMVQEAYEDGPLPIGYNQTISQPYIVAYMTEALKLKPSDKVLEIGTGCGYQSAVLAKLVHKVFTIEIVEPLAYSARDRLARLGYSNIHTRLGDGYRGWPAEAPFDAIIVTAAPSHVPQPLIDQLAVGGRLVVPVGTWYQSIKRLTRTATGIVQEDLLPVQFVPMTGEATHKH